MKENKLNESDTVIDKNLSTTHKVWLLGIVSLAVVALGIIFLYISLREKPIAGEAIYGLTGTTPDFEINVNCDEAVIESGDVLTCHLILENVIGANAIPANLLFGSQFDIEVTEGFNANPNFVINSPIASLQILNTELEMDGNNLISGVLMFKEGLAVANEFIQGSSVADFELIAGSVAGQSTSSISLTNWRRHGIMASSQNFGVTINPGSQLTCRDVDNDGYGVCPDCGTANGCSFDGEDCDDGNDEVYPTALELCNGIDDNCNGNVDEGCGGILGDTNGDGVVRNGDAILILRSLLPTPLATLSQEEEQRGNVNYCKQNGVALTNADAIIILRALLPTPLPLPAGITFNGPQLGFSCVG